MDPILALDIGGTNLRIGLVEPDLTLCEPVKVLSSQLLCIGENAIASLIRIIKNDYDKQKIRAIAVGIPGAVSNDHKAAILTPNLKDTNGLHLMHHTDVGTPLSEAFGVPCIVSKDTDQLLACDIAMNHLSGIIAGCYIGTGLGAAVSIHGTPLSGSKGVAMDAGHMHLYRNSQKCGCGKTGCAEAVGSGTALEAIHRQYFADMSLEDIFLRCSDTPEILSFLYDCAQVPATLATLFNPDVLILGGGVVEGKGFPMEQFSEIIRSLVGSAVVEEGFRILYPHPLPEKGVIGGACLADRILNYGG
ncbi:MAG: ROK family protein [Lachnospiraceae bacterium]|nr:ROK family protein [Lachnospiraceae bacterium]